MGPHQQRWQLGLAARQAQDQVDPLAVALVEAVLLHRPQHREGLVHVAAHGQQAEAVPVQMTGPGGGLEVLEQLAVKGTLRGHRLGAGSSESA